MDEQTDTRDAQISRNVWMFTKYATYYLRFIL